MRLWQFVLTGLLLMYIAISVNAAPVEGEYYLGAYLGEQKIGYMVSKVEKLDGENAEQYKISSEMTSQLKILGTDVSQNVTTVVIADSEMNPQTQDFTMSSGGKTTSIKAIYYPDRVECTISSGSSRTVTSVPIPSGVKLIVDTMYGVSPKQMELGSKFEAHYFNPLTVAIDNVEISFEREEKLSIDGVEYDTQVLISKTNLGNMTLWQTEYGKIVQIQAVMGIRLIAENREEAESGLGGGTPHDFAKLTSIKPDNEIPNARELRKLYILLGGLEDKAFALSDIRQKVAYDEKTKEAQVKIIVPETGPNRTIKLPIENRSLEKELESTPYIDSESEIVRRQAQKIAQEETNVYLLCSSLRKWLYENMLSKADVGVTRSASDVLSNRQGVCRDYAIAFAGMARSLGIPTKVVSGLVYSQDAFYYHAWVECWIGRWIPYDATMDTDFVDATHIKLAEGDATSMFNLSKVIGRLTIKVVSYAVK